MYIFSFLTGFCCGYLIYITKTMKESFGRTQGFWLTVVLPLLFFLTLVPDLGKMAKFSIMAQISNLLAFMVVFWFDFEHLHLFEAMATRREFNVEGLASFFSVAIYCYEVSFRVPHEGKFFISKIVVVWLMLTPH